MKEILDQLKQQVYQTGRGEIVKLQKLPGFLKLKELSPEEKAANGVGLVQVIAEFAIETNRKYSKKFHIDQKVVDIWDDVLRFFLTPDVPYTEKQLLQFIKDFKKYVNIHQYYETYIYWPVEYTVDCIWAYVKKNGLSESMRNCLQDLMATDEFSKEFYRTEWNNEEQQANCKSLIERILVSEGDESVVMPYKWKQDDAVGKHLYNLLKDLSEEDKFKYFALFHAANSNGSKPNKKFIDSLKPLINDIGPREFIPFISSIVKHLSTQEITEVYVVKMCPNFGTPINGWKKVFLHKKTQTLIKCLIWTCNDYDDPELRKYLAELCITAFNNKSPQIGTACIHSLAGNDEGKELLKGLKNQIPHENSKKLIDAFK